MNLSTSEMSISRDVVFHEHIFPYLVPDLQNVISSGIYFPSISACDFDSDVDQITSSTDFTQDDSAIVNYTDSSSQAVFSSDSSQACDTNMIDISSSLISNQGSLRQPTSSPIP